MGDLSRSWDWEYYPPAEPWPVKHGIKTKSKRGRIGKTWWSERWIAVLESLGMGARLDRGRSYARRGQVVSMRVREGIVTAKVQGTQPRPYDVTIRLDPLSDESWDRAAEVMASRAVFAAKLLSGEMPHEIEEAFEEAGSSLFPESRRDLKTECSCPDWANPCKHIAAVYYLLAEQFDEDPFLLFTLRGRSKERIVDALNEKRAANCPVEEAGPTDPVEAEPLLSTEEAVARFWYAEGLKEWRAPPSQNPVDAAGLRELGPCPYKVRGRDLSEILEQVYRAAGRAWGRETT